VVAGAHHGRVLQTERLGDDLLVVRLDRAERLNALGRPLIEQLTSTLEQAGAEAGVRGVVLAGAGRSFCAGVDLHEFATASTDTASGLIRSLARLCRTVRRLPKPVACAVHGHCLGGALELAACCDLRVCAPDARLGMPEVGLGIPSVIDAVMLQHLIGVGRARELLLTGDPISGETAYAWGLANRLAPADGVVEAAVDLIRRTTRHAPEVLAEQKRLHQQWLELPYERAVETSIARLVAAFAHGTPQRIAAARLERRRSS
jgi:enoyl-CoA hydratase